MRNYIFIIYNMSYKPKMVSFTLPFSPYRKVINRFLYYTIICLNFRHILLMFHVEHFLKNLLRAEKRRDIYVMVMSIPPYPCLCFIYVTTDIFCHLSDKKHYVNFWLFINEINNLLFA